MTAKEHATAVRATLRDLERATAKHHRALQAALEELGPGAGIAPGDVTALGGGTPKTPDT